MTCPDLNENSIVCIKLGEKHVKWILESCMMVLHTCAKDVQRHIKNI